MTSVAILEDIHGHFLKDPSMTAIRDKVDLRVFTEPLTAKHRAARLKGIEVVVGLRERTRFDAAFLKDAPDVKLIIQTGRVGPNLDMDAITNAGVLVAQAPGGGSASTVELTFALIFAILRQVPQSDSRIRAGRWDVPYGRVLQGRTLGLIGMGRIGGQVAEIASRGFGANVLAWSKNMTQDRAAMAGANAASMDDLLKQSDVVSVHLALNEGTRNLLTAEKLALMKPDAYFINTSRGTVLDEPALTRMLQDGRLAGAGLDVFWEEPLPQSNPLVALDNVVLTPHIGWPADQSYAAFAESTAKVVESYLKGDTINLANPEARR